MQVHLTLKSSNAKTGAIPVSTTSKASCPSTCPLKDDGCYANDYHLNMHWSKVTSGQRGTDWMSFTRTIASLPSGVFWRHNQAGDLPQDGTGRIDGYLLGELVKANTGKRGFTYTHHEPTLGENAKYIKGCNDFGFTVNLSANTLDHADSLAALNIAPVAVVLPITQTSNTTTPQGRKVVVCPATQKDNVTCDSCRLCAVSDRKVIIGFPAHGTGAKKAEKAVTFYKRTA